MRNENNEMNLQTNKKDVAIAVALEVCLIFQMNVRTRMIFVNEITTLMTSFIIINLYNKIIKVRVWYHMDSVPATRKHW